MDAEYTPSKGREADEIMRDTWTVQNDVSPEQKAYEATLPRVKEQSKEPF